MKGSVVGINNRNGWVAVKLSNDECSIFEPLGGYSVEVGDVISGEIDDVGSGCAYNHSQEEEMDIMVEFTSLSLSQVKGKLFP